MDSGGGSHPGASRSGVSPVRLRVSVIMPVYNATAFLPRSLPPLLQALARGEIDELIAIDDTSSDRSAALATELGARVIPSGGRLGPGGARNIAAKQATGDILWFVDSDVVVAEHSADRVRDAFNSPEVWATFGSYDDAPAAPNFGSQYKNLLHHHHHQIGKTQATTFWAGCGAIRRKEFLGLGGFDAKRYTKPSIEDIELGYRIREKGGLITLDRDLLSKHLKTWSVVELVRVDIFRRALPWARLMLSRGSVTDDLNVSQVERLRAVLAGFFFLSIAVSVLGLAPWWIPFILLGLTFAFNARLLLMFNRKRGPLFAAGALLFHQFYYIYSTTAFAWCWAEAKLSAR